jgi:hypothetical protein
MTIQVKNAESVDSPNAAPMPRHERRSAIVLLVCTIIAIAMIGLLLDSITETFVRVKGPTTASAALLVPGARDDFARVDNPRSMGRSETGQVWRTAPGRWGIAGHAARVVEPGKETSLATVAVGVPDGRVEAVITRMAPGAGIAFRCRNALNCWRVEAVPQLGTWNVVKVVKGKETRVTSLGTVPVADGTKVAVTMKGGSITFYIDDKETTSIDDRAFALEARAGLSLREPASASVARWSSFVELPPSAPGVLTVRDAEIHDEFARTRATNLGTTPTGQRWTSVSGAWSVTTGMAAIATPSTTSASLALVDIGSANGVVQTTIPAPQPRTGIAFRCRDLDNCWRLEVVPGYSTWNIYKVVDGTVSDVGNLGKVTTASGTTVSVEMNGSRLVFFVNGVARRTIDDDTLSSEHRAGLVVEPGPLTGASRWSEFSAAPARRP